jgi:dTMP kinase
MFITFEGIEGSGKTTQIALLAEWLTTRTGKVPVSTREPGGCPIANQIRGILLDSANRDMTGRAELLLYAAARAQHVAEVIRPALDRGQVVLCDRYCDATVAYQGFGRGLSRTMIMELNCLATDGTLPDLTLLLDFAPQTGLERACQRNAATSGPDEGRFEQEALDFHQRVRDGYLALAAEHPRFRIIDATGSQQDVAKRIRATVADYLQARHNDL